jgi:uncharacterized SAM-binding protein YcdF (DUF218 family)
MFLYTGKVLSTIATPLGFAIAALVVAAFSGRRVPRAIAALAALSLLFFSSGLCSRLLLRTLEDPYVLTSVSSASSAQAIVVLGGYLRIETRIPRPVEIGSAADRLYCAAQLYHAGKAPLILLSGGNVAFLSSPTAPSEASAASGVLEEWGIPPSAILIEGQSQNTHENAEFSHRILAERGINRILLVTSAFHMRRASASFRRTGLAVLPVAADFMAQAEGSDLPLSLLPNANALADSGLAIKEWTGLIVYRFRGWTQ